jgi:hypothetical protein
MAEPQTVDRSQQRHTAREVVGPTGQEFRHTHYPWEVVRKVGELGSCFLPRERSECWDAPIDVKWGFG